MTIAEQKGDFELLKRISGCDLFACEARYHPSCRRNYVASKDRGKSRNDEDIKQQEVLEEAHRGAFDKVCSVIDEKVVKDRKVVRLSHLRNVYI